MPEKHYDPFSGAVIYTPTATDRRQRAAERQMKQQQKQIDELISIVKSMQGEVTDARDDV